MSPKRSSTILGLVFVSLVIGGLGPARAAPIETFSYPLRAGESLSDVSRIFRVPIAELVERNQLGDVDRLKVGQRIEVPNAFAAEAAENAAERDRAIAARERLERELGEHRATIDGLEATIGEKERRVAALDRRLGTLANWELAAKTAAAFVLCFLVWTLKLGHERAVLTRRLRSLTNENQALSTARHRMREALSQLELRYQQLYSSKRTAKRKTVEEGVTRLERLFERGTRELERWASKIEHEREREDQLLDTQQKALGWLFHPVREVIARHRLKET